MTYQHLLVELLAEMQRFYLCKGTELKGVDCIHYARTRDHFRDILKRDVSSAWINVRNLLSCFALGSLELVNLWIPLLRRTSHASFVINFSFFDTNWNAVLKNDQTACAVKVQICDLVGRKYVCLFRRQRSRFRMFLIPLFSYFM